MKEFKNENRKKGMMHWQRSSSWSMLSALSCVTRGEVRPYDIDIAAFGPGFYVHKFVGHFFPRCFHTRFLILQLYLRGVESTKISKSTPSVVTLTAQAVRRVTRESAMLHSKDRTVSSQTTSAVLGNETHASTFLSSQSVTPNVDVIHKR
ncbi:uncharacterized protein LAJ45_05475 [Morchella importuna]|uniref:uncharacterized protein n=1 Tax=Morchella importuna TaxID=1174673 RepID=UPI001E8E7111|nr:uncharacterized protein LAJ45_05475 [Morchella importuna]KAH8150264.1 hypothetical protein LAJ45_05475 [Morchella importuna]